MKPICSLRELCISLSKCSSYDEYELCFSQFYESIRLLKSAEILSSFTMDDLNLSNIYCQCHVLCIYEYLCDIADIKKDDSIMSKYGNLYCPMQSTSYYKMALDLTGNEESVVRCFKKELSKSIEPFRSRGIPALVFNPTV